MRDGLLYPDGVLRIDRVLQPALLSGLPDLGVDARAVVNDLEAGRAGP